MNDSQWMPAIDIARCISCWACIEHCPVNALGQQNGKARVVAPSRCTYCMACEDICPTAAIELPFLIVEQRKES